FTLPAPTEPDTPSLHVALPISNGSQGRRAVWVFAGWRESVVVVMRDAAVVVRRGGIAVVRRSHPAAGIASGSGRSYNRLQRVAVRLATASESAVVWCGQRTATVPAPIRAA